VTPSHDHAPGWQVWANLWIVYIVWGSTYLAIRYTVETLPPLLTAGFRFVVAGLVLYAFLALRRGAASLRISRREAGASTVVGAALLLGGNGGVMLAEQTVPSGLAALIIASVPLWVVALRYVFEGGVDRATLVGALAGFTGVGLLVAPGGAVGGADVVGLLLLVGASLSWASGSFFSRYLPMPKDPFTSTAHQMVFGGLVAALAGVLHGELGRIDLNAASAASLLGVGYLITFGSLLAFTAYVWLLQHAPISKVATYAYVNPVVAIFLGWVFLDEAITGRILAGAALIIAAVAYVVTRSAEPVKPRQAGESLPALAQTE
jgi:drug/metabolite transporter (DMT)-like permease